MNYEEMEDFAATSPRGSTRVSLLRERNFRLFLVGYTASMIGTGVVPVALSFALLKDGGA